MARHTEYRTLLTCGWFVLAVALISGCRGQMSTEDLIALTKSKDSADRVRAIQTLAERGAEADVVVPALMESLKDSEAFVRRDAARALGQIGPPASVAVATLQTASRDRNQHVREAVAEALKKINPDAPAPQENSKKR